MSLDEESCRHSSSSRHVQPCLLYWSASSQLVFQEKEVSALLLFHILTTTQPNHIFTTQ